MDSVTLSGLQRVRLDCKGFACAWGGGVLLELGKTGGGWRVREAEKGCGCGQIYAFALSGFQWTFEDCPVATVSQSESFGY